MKTRMTLNQFLDDLRKATEIPYSRLDTVLERPHALDRELARILHAFGEKPLVDDRFASRILDEAEGDAPYRKGGPVARFVARTQRLSAQEELHLAKRIEFARRRLERTIASSSAPTEVKELYFDRIETPEFARTPVKSAFDRRPDEGTLQARWSEYLSLRNDMIVANVPLVERIAVRYRTYGIPHDDLVQHGDLGLIRAADKFDWRKNVRFRTYAEWWIRQAIERATDTDRDVVHVPRPMRQLISKANHLHRKSGVREPLDATRFAKMMNVERGAAARAFSIKSGVISLDRSGPDDGQPMRNDLVGADLGRADEREDMEHLRHRLDGMIDGLPEREQRVIHLRYGLRGETPHTLEQVGEILQISRERVRQLQMRAIDHLRVSAADPRLAAV